MNAEMCTFKLLKALCSVLATTESESPEQTNQRNTNPPHPSPRVTLGSRNSQKRALAPQRA